MAKKILGLVGSGRKVGNSEILVKEALLSAGEEYEKEIIRLNDLDIKPCSACYACLPKGADCHLQDDFNYLLGKIKEADGIVLAAPVYFLGPHSIIKVIQDRFLAVGNEGAAYAGKPCITILTYGVDGWKGYSMPALNLFPRFLNLNLVDSIAVKAANPGESVVDKETVLKIQNLGKALFDDKYQRQPLPNECPVCWNQFLCINPVGEVDCPICGAQGKVVMNNDKLSYNFPPNQHHRFTKEAIDEHFEEFLPGKKAEFLKNRELYKSLQNPYKAYDWFVKP